MKNCLLNFNDIDIYDCNQFKWEGRKAGRTNERRGTDHVISGPTHYAKKRPFLLGLPGNGKMDFLVLVTTFVH